ncbi:heme-dependent oxidative N-demethylase subunit alpha family protein [Deinococcus cellulosilyticus]|uniref:DUF3445 domain-containing protein n=1 Tax=Deinococcus cellulosilyticus (strain DSM 18568 / NBRC 106333 / KACC 11606 / 5516J-15) TaxID=1223518 RepID=A0A511MVG0_DEIC1|nr:heme-dependent oxidative N-demethylase subunit alpha family protein [Deinococcus cellulosilyticus]GEM44391.1 hypothetical protein DC3_00260 [Deinococcus cellulosilyticus NBRC 106333 = KACC 11606]
MAFSPDLLTDPDPPFMVQDRFEIKADVFPLGSVLNGRLEQNHFAEDRLLFSYLQKKLDVLQQHPERHRALTTDDPQGLSHALWTALQVYKREFPQLLSGHDTEVDLKHLGLRLHWDPHEIQVTQLQDHALGTQVLDHLQQQQGVTRLLDAVSLSAQEDLVVLRQDPEGGHAEALSVCFPSGWDPREKLGVGFAGIHHPVADHQRLLKASGNMMRAIFHKGPFIRFSWGLTPSPDLNAHPEHPRTLWNPLWEAEPDLLGEKIFLRMERQTTLALPELQRGLFTIRVYVNSLSKTLTRNPELRPRLHNLLSSVKPDVLEYKGMQPLKAPILRYLESHK